MAFRPFSWVWICALAACLATGAAAAPPPALYLLAATPSSGTASTYPATLYRAGQGKDAGKLVKVRQIFTSEQGLFDVRDDLDGHLYLLDDKLNQVSIVHEAHPAQADTITPSAPLDFYWPAYGAVAGATPGLLLASVQDGRRVITRVLADASPSTPRISTGGAGFFSLYKNFRFTGAVGGPNPPIIPQAVVEGRQLALLDLDHPEVSLDLTPAAFKSPFVMPGASLNVNLIAVTPAYFAFSLADPNGGPAPTPIYVHNLHTGAWSTVEVPAATIEPASRLFGSWLATITKQWVQGQTDPPPPLSPGMENERETAPHLGGPQAQPNVREAYALLQQSFYMPGDLELDNLADGRKLTIHTGQQDSEVLDVTAAGEVLYRVNDAIYAGRIMGTQLAGVRRLLQGEAVPEVHWVFYAPPPPGPAQGH